MANYRRDALVVLSMRRYAAQHDAVLDLQALLMSLRERLDTLSAEMEAVRRANQIVDLAMYRKRAAALDPGPDAA